MTTYNEVAFEINKLCEEVGDCCLEIDAKGHHYHLIVSTDPNNPWECKADCSPSSHRWINRLKNRVLKKKYGESYVSNKPEKRHDKKRMRNKTFGFLVTLPDDLVVEMIQIRTDRQNVVASNVEPEELLSVLRDFLGFIYEINDSPLMDTLYEYDTKPLCMPVCDCSGFALNIPHDLVEDMMYFSEFAYNKNDWTEEKIVYCMQSIVYIIREWMESYSTLEEKEIFV